MSSVRREARRAGILYFLLALLAPVGLLYVPGRIVVSGDAAATAANLRAQEGLLRLGIGTELAHQVIVIFLVLVLYRLFEPVSRPLARQLVVLGALVSVPIMFVNVLNEIAALTLARGADFLDALGPEQRDGLAYLFLRLHGQGIVVASVFWGLWLFPFGLLVIRSRFLPKWLGYLLLIAGAAYLAAAFAILVAPALRPYVGPVAEILELAEIPIILWLLIRGAKPTDEPA